MIYKNEDADESKPRLVTCLVFANIISDFISNLSKNHKVSNIIVKNGEGDCFSVSYKVQD